MAYFFISYSRNDGKEIAHNLRNSIASLDSSHDIFIDDKSIAVGVDWQQSLSKSISTCDYFILVLSPSSVESVWVQKEVEMAKASEVQTGMKKLFVIKNRLSPFPDYLPHNNQVLEMTDNWCVDFYRLMSGVFANQSFYQVEDEITAHDDYYDISLSVSCPAVHANLIQSVEYRFDHEFMQPSLNFKKVLLRKNKADNYRVDFWTKESVIVFVVVYLKNSKQIPLVKRVVIG